MVQFCLAGPKEIPIFKDAMRSIADGHGMAFEDSSARTESGLTVLSQGNRNVQVAHPTVSVAADRDGRFNFGAMNFGEAPSQIVIGFNGSDHVTASKFSDDVVYALARSWRIHEVANVDTHGAIPLPRCP